MIARNLAVHVSAKLRHKTHVQFVPWYNNYKICAEEHAHILIWVVNCIKIIMATTKSSKKNQSAGMIAAFWWQCTSPLCCNEQMNLHTLCELLTSTRTTTVILRRTRPEQGGWKNHVLYIHFPLCMDIKCMIRFEPIKRIWWAVARWIASAVHTWCVETHP